MRKYILLILILFLSACSSGGTSDDQEVNGQEQNEAEVESEKETAQEENDNEDKRTEEEIEREGSLAEVGDVVNDATGRVELIDIVNNNEIIDHGPLKIDLVNFKVIRWTDISNDITSLLSNYGTVNGNQIDYLQIRMVVENTGNKDIKWQGITNLVTDKKQQLDGIIDEFLSSALVPNQYVDGDYFGNVKKEYVIGYILEDADIDNIRLVLDSIHDIDYLETIAKKRDYEINFN